MKNNRFLKFTILPVLMVIMAVIVVLYRDYRPNAIQSLAPLSHAQIMLDEGEKIHFYKEGFAISGTSSRFFDPDGIPITPPFPDDTSSNGQWIINMSSSNYMLIDGKWIYNTSSTPFKKIYELDSSAGYGIQEFPGYIVISIKDENNILTPKLLDLDQNILLDLEDIDSLYYMDSDYDSEGASLSVLALALDTSFPSSKILNYKDGITLFSVISATDKTYYKIFRLPSHVVVVGTHDIICYNIDGSLQWSITNKEIKNCTVTETESGFVFYYSYPIDNGDGIFFNALAINLDGSFTKMDYPRDLVDLQAFGNNLIGLRYGRNILVLDENGHIENEFHVSEDIVTLYYSEYHKDNLYLLDRENQLHIYSTKKEASIE